MNFERRNSKWIYTCSKRRELTQHARSRQHAHSLIHITDNDNDVVRRVSSATTEFRIACIFNFIIDCNCYQRRGGGSRSARRKPPTTNPITRCQIPEEKFSPRPCRGSNLESPGLLTDALTTAPFVAPFLCRVIKFAVNRFKKTGSYEKKNPR